MHGSQTLSLTEPIPVPPGASFHLRASQDLDPEHPDFVRQFDDLSLMQRSWPSGGVAHGIDLVPDSPEACRFGLNPHAPAICSQSIAHCRPACLC